MQEKAAHFALFAIAAALVFAGSNLQAQTIVWNHFSGVPNPYYHAGIDWHAGINRVGFNAPTSNQTARFDSPFTCDAVLNGVDLFISYAGGDGNDVTLFTAVPEPGSAGILLLGVLALAVTHCRLARSV